jgi:hypothetical protein
MALQWVSVALTLTGIFIWFSGTNQGLGYGIFMAGGVMWFILQRAEKKLRDDSEQAPDARPITQHHREAQKSKPLRQSDSR